MADKKDIYKMKVWCPNCDFGGEVEINKGVKVDEHPCPECGNLGLRKKLKPMRIVPNIPNYR
jgi:ssDNA-binding Zn-finger/Zn-ribbon topoisomerase 1